MMNIQSNLCTTATLRTEGIASVVEKWHLWGGRGREEHVFVCQTTSIKLKSNRIRDQQGVTLRKWVSVYISGQIVG